MSNKNSVGIKVGSYRLGPGFIVLLLALAIGLIYIAAVQFDLYNKFFGGSSPERARVNQPSNEFSSNSMQSTGQSPNSSNSSAYQVVVPDLPKKNRNPLPQPAPLMANAQCMGGVVLVKRFLFSFAFETDGVNHNMKFSDVIPHMLDLGQEAQGDALVREIGGAIRSAISKCPTNATGNIQFVMNSTSAELPAVKKALPQLQNKFVVTISNLATEGKNALLSAIADSQKYNSFVFDITAEFVRVSWYDQAGTPQTYKLDVGYDLYTKNMSPAELTRKINDAIAQVPPTNKQNCIAIWSALKKLRPSSDNRWNVYLSDIQDVNVTSIEDEKNMIRSGLFILNTAQGSLDNEIIIGFDQHYFVGFSKTILKNRK